MAKESTSLPIILNNTHLVADSQVYNSAVVLFLNPPERKPLGAGVVNKMCLRAFSSSAIYQFFLKLWLLFFPDFMSLLQFL